MFGICLCACLSEESEPLSPVLYQKNNPPHHFWSERKMGSMVIRVLNKRLWSSSLHHFTLSNSSTKVLNAFHSRFLGPLVSCHHTPTLSSFPRFESTKSQNQLLHDSNQDIQVTALFFFLKNSLFFFYPEIYFQESSFYLLDSCIYIVEAFFLRA